MAKRIEPPTIRHVGLLTGQAKVIRGQVIDRMRYDQLLDEFSLNELAEIQKVQGSAQIAALAMAMGELPVPNVAELYAADTEEEFESGVERLERRTNKAINTRVETLTRDYFDAPAINLAKAALFYELGKLAAVLNNIAGKVLEKQPLAPVGKILERTRNGNERN